MSFQLPETQRFRAGGRCSPPTRSPARGACRVAAVAPSEGLGLGVGEQRWKSIFQALDLVPKGPCWWQDCLCM